MFCLGRLTRKHDRSCLHLLLAMAFRQFMAYDVSKQGYDLSRPDSADYSNGRRSPGRDAVTQLRGYACEWSRGGSSDDFDMYTVDL